MLSQPFRMFAGFDHRRRGEVKLQKKIAHEKWRSAVILKYIREAVVAVDADRRIIQLNPAAEDLLGISDEKARGRPLDDVVRLEDPETRAKIAPEDVTGDVVAIGFDGIEHTVAESIGPIVDEDGGLQGMVFVYRDVTAQRKMERDLQSHCAAGEACVLDNCIKSELVQCRSRSDCTEADALCVLSGYSHDLRGNADTHSSCVSPLSGAAFAGEPELAHFR